MRLTIPIVLWAPQYTGGLPACPHDAYLTQPSLFRPSRCRTGHSGTTRRKMNTRGEDNVHVDQHGAVIRIVHVNTLPVYITPGKWVHLQQGWMSAWSRTWSGVNTAVHAYTSKHGAAVQHVGRTQGSASRSNRKNSPIVYQRFGGFSRCQAKVG